MNANWASVALLVSRVLKMASAESGRLYISESARSRARRISLPLWQAPKTTVRTITAI